MLTCIISFLLLSKEIKTNLKTSIWLFLLGLKTLPILTWTQFHLSKTKIDLFWSSFGQKLMNDSKRWVRRLCSLIKKIKLKLASQTFGQLCKIFEWLFQKRKQKTYMSILIMIKMARSRIRNFAGFSLNCGEVWRN